MFSFKQNSFRRSGTVLAALILALPATASAATYYVDAVNGSDANSGTAPGAGNAWQTISHAATNVPAGTSGVPNIIMVAAGTYDNSTNGESFPIIFNNNYVSLTGAGSASTAIDAETLADDALTVDAMGFAISGFTFENANDAIDISEGGFTISNNVFESTIGQGIYFYKNDTDLSDSVSFPDMSITSNTFHTTTTGVFVDITQDFDYITENLTLSFGNFTVSGNTFAVTSSDGIDATDLLDVDDLLNGTITVGDFTFTNNTFSGGTTAFDFDSEIDEVEDCQVTIGNVVVSNNTFTDHTSYAINLDHWPIGDVYGTSTVILGELTISDNAIMATNYVTHPNAYGIYIAELDEKIDIYDDSTVTTGTINVTNNTIDVDGYGIYAYSDGIYYIGEEYWEDTASITTGARNFSNNTVNSNGNNGIYIELEYIGYDMYGSTTVSYGDFNIINNTVTSDDEALYLYWYEAGIYMHENSTCTLGAVTISGNSLTSADYTAFEYDLEYCGYDMYDDSTVTFGPTSFSNNTVSGGATFDEAMYFYFYENAYSMYDNSFFSMSPFTIDNNTVNALDGAGMYVEFDGDENTAYMEDDSEGILPDWIITNNTFDVIADNTGIYYYIYETPEENYGKAVSHFGSILIDGNTFNPNKDAGFDIGIEIGIEDAVEDAYGPAVAAYGDITIINNTFYNMEDIAVFLWYDEIGYAFTGAPVLTMGDISVGMNTIDTSDYGIYVDLYDLYTEESATVTVGDLTIYDNTLTGISNDGIFVQYYNENSDPETAALTIGETTISGNMITGAPGVNSGIYLYIDNATEGIVFGTPVVKNNTISAFDTGVYAVMFDQDDLTLSCNWLQNNSNEGMHFETNAAGIVVSSNSITGNTTNGLAVHNGYTAEIKAENNWWGDKAGPAACASCNGINPGDMGTVDYTPWLTYEPQKSRCGLPFPWVMFTPATTGMGPAVP